MRLEIVTLDTSKQDATTKAPLISAKQPVTGDDDVEEFGDLPLMQCLGVSSFPYGKTDAGYCEGVVAHGVGARDGVVLGARDTRTAKIVGNGKPGDTIVHSTGPNQAAQLQLKEAKKQAVLVTKGTDGKQILLSLDGNTDKVTIAAFGMCFEMNKTAQTIALMANGTSGIVIGKDGVQIIGKLMTGSPAPGLQVAMGTPANLAAASLVGSTSIAGI